MAVASMPMRPTMAAPSATLIVTSPARRWADPGEHAEPPRWRLGTEIDANNRKIAATPSPRSDYGNDGTVRISDLFRAVNIALGSAPVGDCFCGGGQLRWHGDHR